MTVNQIKKGPMAGLSFHLREIASVGVQNKWKAELWLFGRTVDRQSVAVRVFGFRPHFFVDRPDQDQEEFVEQLNCDLKPFPQFKDEIILSAVPDARIPVVGYTDSTPRPLLRVEYANPADIWRIRRHFASEKYTVEGKKKKLRLYHDDWGIESQFLHDRGLKMNSWITVDKHRSPKAFPDGADKASTTCAIERYCYDVNVSTAKNQSAVGPILVCVVRTRARGRAGQQPDPSKDPLACVAIRTYWLGHDETGEAVFIGSEKAILDAFFARIRDVDCFSFLSDNCHDLKYISCRGQQRRLGKFLSAKEEELRLDKDSGAVRSLRHPGRSRMDVKESLKKMFVKPKLEGFTLKDAAFHPKITKKTPSPKMGQYSYRTLSPRFAEECAEEARWIMDVDVDNNGLLGFVELSKASYGPLTAMVENGQQIRVWKKFISKMHAMNLLANRDQLRRPVVIVRRPRSESSYPDPPVVSNLPCSGAKRKKAAQSSGNKRVKNLFGEVVVQEKKKKAPKRFTGGYVCDPEVGFYADDPRQATFTMDFGSLYPSIIEGYKVCYMRLLYDRKLLKDDRFEKEYVSLNDTECLVLIKSKEGVPVQTFLPETTSEVVLQRKSVRARMKKPGLSAFELSSLDAQQLACKVFQNALYGFLGVEKHAVFAAPVLMAMVCCIGQNMIKRVRHRLISGHGCYNVYGDTDSVMVQFPCPAEHKTKEAVFDYYYKKAVTVEKECTAMFPPPNILEFETMKYPFGLYGKKNYFAFEYNEKSWRDKPKVAVKGLPFKKRDRCPWVRRVGHFIVDCLLRGETGKIVPFLANECTALSAGEIDIDHLAVSTSIQENYKSDNLIQLHTARKIKERSGRIVEPGTRMSYVVVPGKEKLYLRGEDPEHVRSTGASLDLQHYLVKQLKNPIETLLTHHPRLLAEFRKIVAKTESAIYRKKSGTKSIASYFN